MRNPYIVGRWVQGPQHYGRQRLIDFLFHSQDLITWVVGTRRMGKTSLLRQLEWLLDQGQGNSRLVPLLLDLQGVESMAALGDELLFALEDNLTRFEPLGVNVAILRGKEATTQLRLLQRELVIRGYTLFLLIDEAEAFVNIAEHDSSGLARLRKILQNGRQRTVMTATKLLIRLGERIHHWLTSPFLAGVRLVNLWSLDPASAQALVRQEQGPTPVEVDEKTLEDILFYTNRHPYLIQYLCYHLFDTRPDGTGYLRPVYDEALEPDPLLAGFFRIDFSHLSPRERAILLTVARRSLLRLEELEHEFPDISREELWKFVYGLYKLGLLRRVLEDQWAVGNEYLRRWLRQNMASLERMTESLIGDQEVAQLLEQAQRTELTYLQQQQALLQRRLEHLLRQQEGYDAQAPPELVQEIQAVRQELEEIRHQLADLAQEG